MPSCHYRILSYARYAHAMGMLHACGRYCGYACVSRYTYALGLRQACDEQWTRMHDAVVTLHEMHAHKVYAYEGFCEDLARQTTVTHLSQLQLGFRRCRIWVSVTVVAS